MATAEELKARIKALQLQVKAKRKRDNQRFAQQNMLPSPDTVVEPLTEETNRFGDTAAEFSAPFRQNMRTIAQRSSFDRPIADRAKDVGLMALNTLGAAYTGGAGLLGDMFGGDRTQERKAARDFMLLGEVAVPELAGAPAAVTRLARKASPISQRQAVAQSAQDLGITPTLSMNNRTAGVLETTLANAPFSAGSINRAQDRTVSQMGDAFTQASERLGTPTTREGAGEALKSGAESFVNKFEEKSSKLYNQLDSEIGFNSFVTAPRSIAVLEEITKNASKYPEIDKFLKKPIFAKILRDLEVDGSLNALPYEALKDLRSTIGKSIGSFSGVMSDLDQGQLKKLYGALSQDLELAARSAGPKALNAYTRANNYYSAGQSRIENALKNVLKADTEKKAYNDIVAMTLEASPKGSTKKLLQLKKSLPQDQWSTVSATIIRKLGETPPQRSGAPDATDFAEFNPANFLTNWNKMDNSAKTVLLSGNAPASVKTELDKLAQVVEKFKQRPVATGSAPANIMTAFLAGSIFDLGGALALGGGLFTGTRMLTSNVALKAINSATAGDFTKLRKLAREDSALGSEASTLLRLIAAETARQQEQQ
tara:strand:- start:450 stop:2240 length:1791 start_codon:yes stop_codon:yes gene_type:complete